MANFHEIIKELSQDLKKVDSTILEFAKGKSPLIQEISNHLISSGGKRIRPILLILAAKLCGSKDSGHQHDLAAAVELIHSATLLHDDVVDDSEVRRGKKTANSIWDNKASILVGDYLFSIAFQLMVRSENLRVLDLLSKASSIMADGEVMQLENSNDINLSEEKYLEIIYGKTAVLFSAACEVGALINNKSEEKIKSLSEFGKNLGVIFQIVDDLLDYSSKEQVLGKDVGNDLFEGKVTLPIIITSQMADETEKKLISDIFTKNLYKSEKSQDDLNQILPLMEKYDVFSKAKEKAFYYHSLAKKNLEIFPDSKAKEDLLEILNYSMARIS